MCLQWQNVRFPTLITIDKLEKYSGSKFATFSKMNYSQNSESHRKRQKNHLKRFLLVKKLSWYQSGCHKKIIKVTKFKY